MKKTDQPEIQYRRCVIDTPSTLEGLLQAADHSLFDRPLMELSLSTLYDSSVAAFPRTGKRQHATHPVVIRNLTWLPFEGMKTLFIKGLAQNEGREYNPMILFKGVDYGSNAVTVTAEVGEFSFAPLSLESTDVSLRCNCPDFRYRFAYYNHLDRSLYGRKPAHYIGSGGPPANPMEMSGICKHLMKLSDVLQKADIFVERR